MTAFDRCRRRAHDRCEAMVNHHGRMTRCGVQPVEVHHRLPRSRGGDVLDTLDHAYHLIALCNQHHRFAHTYRGPGLMIDGHVWIDGGQVVYSGPDQYLKQLFPLRRLEWPSDTPTPPSTRTDES